jgi:pimeloyl-ACP methyl ester carboxylesterase
MSRHDSLDGGPHASTGGGGNKQPRMHRPETNVHYFDANGLRVAAFIWGEGPLVLLLHGFPDTAHTWDQIGPSIASAGYRVVAPFLRGYAPTTIPAEDTNTDTLGADVIALIGAVRAQRACIVGHDWGAEAGYAAVALAPERIARLVTVAMPPRAAIRWTPASRGRCATSLLWRYLGPRPASPETTARWWRPCGDAGHPPGSSSVATWSR